MSIFLVNPEDRERPDKRCCHGVSHLIAIYPCIRQVHIIPDSLIIDRVRVKLNLVRYKNIIPNLHTSNKPLIRQGPPCKFDMGMNPNPPLPEPFPRTVVHFHIRGLYIRFLDIHELEIVFSGGAFTEAVADTVRSLSAERNEEIIWALNDMGKGNGNA